MAVREMLCEALDEIADALQQSVDWRVPGRILRRHVEMENVKEVSKNPIHWCHAAAIARCSIWLFGFRSIPSRRK